MKLQLPILSQKYIEGIAKLQGASGGFILHNCRMVELGRYICTFINFHEQCAFLLICTDLVLYFAADTENA
jgi:hypothetical protein